MLCTRSWNITIERKQNNPIFMGFHFSDEKQTTSKSCSMQNDDDSLREKCKTKKGEGTYRDFRENYWEMTSE